MIERVLFSSKRFSVLKIPTIIHGESGRKILSIINTTGRNIGLEDLLETWWRRQVVPFAVILFVKF